MRNSAQQTLLSKKNRKASKEEFEKILFSTFAKERKYGGEQMAPLLTAAK